VKSCWAIARGSCAAVKPIARLRAAAARVRGLVLEIAIGRTPAGLFNQTAKKFQPRRSFGLSRYPWLTLLTLLAIAVTIAYQSPTLDEMLARLP
jgi:hypothetical protein